MPSSVVEPLIHKNDVSSSPPGLSWRAQNRPLGGAAKPATLRDRRFGHYPVFPALADNEAARLGFCQRSVDLTGPMPILPSHKKKRKIEKSIDVYLILC